MSNWSKARKTQEAPRERRISIAHVTRDKQTEPDRIFVYGVEKIGKTTFAANAPGVVFITSENGLAEIDPPPAHFPEVTSWDDVLDCVESLTEDEHEFRTLAIDSVDWVGHLLNEHVRETNNMTMEKFDAYGRGFKIAAEDWRKLLVALNRLQSRRGMEIILVAHAETKNIDPPDSDPYVRYQPNAGGGNAAAALIKQWAKTILFARHELFVKDGEGFAKSKGVSTGRRILHTNWNAAWDAGNRYGLPDELPLDYAAYATARDAGSGQADEIVTDIRAMAADLSEETRAAIERNIEGMAGDPARLSALRNKVADKVAERTEA